MLLFVLAISQSYCQTSGDNLSQVIILPDGTVTPSTAPIHQNGNYYVLTGDIHAELLIQKSNIVINGKGYAITGNGLEQGKGVYLKDLTNVTIRNCVISNFEYSIYLDQSSFCTVDSNHLTDQSSGIVLDRLSINNRISANTINTTRYNSIFLGESSGNKIYSNTIANKKIYKTDF